MHNIKDKKKRAMLIGGIIGLILGVIGYLTLYIQIFPGKINYVMSGIFSIPLLPVTYIVFFLAFTIEYPLDNLGINFSWGMRIIIFLITIIYSTLIGMLIGHICYKIKNRKKKK